MPHLYLYFTFSERHIHRVDSTGLLDTENLSVKLRIFQDANANLPTRFGEGPSSEAGKIDFRPTERSPAQLGCIEMVGVTRDFDPTHS